MEEELDNLVKNLQHAMRTNPKNSKDLRTTVENIMPNRMQELFTRVPGKDCKLLWMDACNCRLESMILSTLLVLPVPIRPSITMDSGSNKDDTTVKMQEILEVNLALLLLLAKGPPTR